jgi:hypothetical protein
MQAADFSDFLDLAPSVGPRFAAISASAVVVAREGG